MASNAVQNGDPGGETNAGRIKQQFNDWSRTYVNEKGILVNADAEPPFSKLMAANRGEIATRIVRAGIELGLKTMAIFSPADRLSPHRFKADESYQVGSTDISPVACYLDIESIIAVAKKQGTTPTPHTPPNTVQ